MARHAVTRPQDVLLTLHTREGLRRVIVRPEDAEHDGRTITVRGRPVGELATRSPVRPTLYPSVYLLGRLSDSPDGVVVEWGWPS